MVVRFIARLLAIVLAYLPAPLLAQDGIYAGGVTAWGAGPYAGNLAPLTARPVLGYRTATYDIGTHGATAQVLRRDRVVLDVFLQPRFFTLINSDASELDGIEREVTLDAGVRYALDVSKDTRLDVSVAQEITGQHDGQEADLRLTQRFVLGPLPLGVYAGAAWRSDNLSRYLYGVTPSEAAAGRPAFALGATTSPYIGVNASVPLSAHVRAFGVVQADFLDPEITESPIVTEDRTLSLGVGIQFSF